MSGFYTIDPRQVDESSRWTKQRLYWQSIHASVNITKIRNFWRFFNVCVVSPRHSSILGVSKNRFKSFNLFLVIKIGNTQRNRLTNRSASFVHQEVQQPICNLCELWFFCIWLKLVFYIKKKKAVELKLQHRISRNNLFSRHLSPETY